MVAPEHAVLPRFAPNQILETRTFNKSFLRKLKPNLGHSRLDWLRFVVLRLDALRVRGMLPLQVSGAALLVDRHYVSLQPYRRLRPNVYVVRVAGQCAMRYVSLHDDHLVLRPRDPQGEVELIRIERDRGFSDYIVGRVCHVGLEV